MQTYAVMGNPIAHSQSPFIHHAFAEQTQQLIDYFPLLVDLNGLPQALDDFQTRGGKGVNITLPFKQQAFQLVDKVSEKAQRAQAVNTIVFQENGKRFGDITDGVGLVRDLINNLQFVLRNKKILMLGAGGAVRGTLEMLLREQPAKLVIANRTPEKADELASIFSDLGAIEARSFSDLNQCDFDLIINGTSASLQQEIPDLTNVRLTPDTLCYDMMYGKTTPFLDWAEQQGAKTKDGWGMLVEQAAESFYLWRNLRPNTKPLLNPAF
jgi:shikimate dehydrogenase